MDSVLQWLDILTFWHWMVLGIALIVIELLAPGIWFLWLGIGAISTGLIVLFLPDLSWRLQAVVFSGFSVVSIMLGRMIMHKTKQAEEHPTLNRRIERYMGRVFVLENDTNLGYGDVRIGDSIWRVQLTDATTQLAAGAKVVVTGVDGSTLKVDPTAD